MTFQAPQQPAPFYPIPPHKVSKPNPRTVRPEDLTWFNTRAGELIQSDYNTCTGKFSVNTAPWNRAPNPGNYPFWRCPVPRFDLYGLSSTCPCELNRCGCSGANACHARKRCALYGGSYLQS